MKVNNPHISREIKIRQERWIKIQEEHIKLNKSLGCDEEGMFDFLKEYIKKYENK